MIWEAACIQAKLRAVVPTSAAEARLAQFSRSANDGHFGWYGERYSFRLDPSHAPVHSLGDGCRYLNAAISPFETYAFFDHNHARLVSKSAADCSLTKTPAFR